MDKRNVHELIDTMFSSELDAANIPVDVLVQMQDVLDGIRENVHALVYSIYKDPATYNVGDSAVDR